MANFLPIYSSSITTIICSIRHPVIKKTKPDLDKAYPPYLKTSLHFNIAIDDVLKGLSSRLQLIRQVTLKTKQETVILSDFYD